VFSQWNEPDSPGCAYGVVKKGERIHAKGAGRVLSLVFERQAQ
jgi:hypothetical protein